MPPYDFSSFPVLTTERLLLRQLRLSDAEDVLVFRGDPHVQRYNGPVYENLHHIYAATIADNHESVRLLENLGFHLDGIRREFSWEEDGFFHNSAMYSQLKDEVE